eukprot:scaffold30_cov416-Prasinococcus_capsulatus_cf.AAC.1
MILGLLRLGEPIGQRTGTDGDCDQARGRHTEASFGGAPRHELRSRGAEPPPAAGLARTDMASSLALSRATLALS